MRRSRSASKSPSSWRASIQKTSSRWRHRLLIVYLLPAAVMVVVAVTLGEGAQAVWAGGAVLSILAAFWFVNRLLEPQTGKKTPGS